MARTINIKLNSSSINKAISELRDYAKDLERKEKLFLERMIAEGVRIGKEEAPVDFIAGGDLRESIHGKIEGNVGYVICDAKKPDGKPYAAYIEFGFGKGKEPWVYFDQKREEFKWSHGMPPNPFMARTAQRLNDMKMQIAKEIFGGK